MENDKRKKNYIIKSLSIGALESFILMFLLSIYAFLMAGESTEEEMRQFYIGVSFFWVIGTLIATYINIRVDNMRNVVESITNVNGVNSEDETIKTLKIGAKNLVLDKITKGEKVTFEPENELFINHDINRDIYEIRGYAIIEKEGAFTKKEYILDFDANKEEYSRFIFDGEEILVINNKTYSEEDFIELLKIGVNKTVMRRITKREKVVAFQPENELLINHDVNRNIYEVKGYVLVEKKGVTTRKDYYIVFDRAKDKYTIFVFNGENIKLKTD